MSYNKGTYHGRLTADVELKKVGDANKAEFSVACTRPFKNNGEYKTDFIPCEAWRGTAEHIAKFFKKGSPIIVEGPLEVEPYTDKEGNKRRSYHIKVDNVYFVDGTKGKSSDGDNSSADDDGSDGYDPSADDDGSAGYDPSADDDGDDDGDLPF